MTMGTVNYMAPEQRTDAKRVDQRADLYAAGVIFYELLTGDLPLGRFALPTERGAPVPISVDKVIVRALARSQDERYQYAGQLDEDLKVIEQEILRTHAGGSPPPSGRGPLRREARDEEVVSTGDVLGGGIASGPGSLAVAGVGSTAMLPNTTWLKRSALLWSAGALVVGTVLGLIALRSCGL
jgi:serine/threonine-protein kinase